MFYVAMVFLVHVMFLKFLLPLLSPICEIAVPVSCALSFLCLSWGVAGQPICFCRAKDCVEVGGGSSLGSKGCVGTPSAVLSAFACLLWLTCWLSTCYSAACDFVWPSFRFGSLSMCFDLRIFSVFPKFRFWFSDSADDSESGCIRARAP